jgi:hypothetical protein
MPPWQALQLQVLLAEDAASSGQKAENKRREKKSRREEGRWKPPIGQAIGE